MTKISISGVIGWDVNPSDIRNQLKDVKGDILVEIGSPGGFVFDGLEISNLLRDYKGGKVTTRLMGIAASMASYIALSGDVVEAHDNAIYMIHNVQGCSCGDHNNLKEDAELFERMSNLLAKAYVKKTGKSLKEIKAIMDNEGWFFGEEAKKAGFVDVIIETEDEKDKEKAMIDAKASLSNCIDILRDNVIAKDDLKKAAALITPIASIENNTDLSPVPGENKIKNNEVKMETLKEFLEKNAGAKAEYDKLIAEAGKEGEKIGTEKVEARVNAAKPYLNNASYPTVGALALEVASGSKDEAILIAAVSAIDAVGGKVKSDVAKTETELLAETKAELEKKEKDGLAQDGSITNEAEFEASQKRI